MMKNLTVIMIGIILIGIALISGCIREIEEEHSEAVYTYVASESLKNETQKHASNVWEKIKSFDEAKFVISEKSYSAIIFIHPYTVGVFDPSTAEWIVVISSIPKMTKETKIAIFRLDYQTLDLKKVYKFIYPAKKELTLDDAIAVIQEEIAKEKGSYQTFVDKEKVMLIGDNYVYSYPASDFGGTIIVNKYAGEPIFYATTIWDGIGKLIIPEEN